MLVGLIDCACFEHVFSAFPESSIFHFMTFLPKIVLGIVIIVADELYSRLAIFLNDLENYRTNASYENHLIAKTVLFQFVNSFLSLFYIAFYLKDMERLCEVYQSFMAVFIYRFLLILSLVVCW